MGRVYYLFPNPSLSQQDLFDTKMKQNKNASQASGRHLFACFERKTRLELATPTLARSCSTN